MSVTTTRADDKCLWHDIEHADFSADLDSFAKLAQRLGGPVVDLGAGTGRVSLQLAGRGHHVIAVEIDPHLARELGERAVERDAPVEVLNVDALDLELSQRVPLVIAPMQFLHIVGGPAARRRLLERVTSSLTDDGVFAAAVLRDDLPVGDWRPDPVPDVREIDGSVHSSLATAVEVGETEIALRRLRQIVSPDGALEEELNEVVLTRFLLAELEEDAISSGMRVEGIEPLPQSAEHEDSLIVTMKPGGRVGNGV